MKINFFIFLMISTLVSFNNYDISSEKNGNNRYVQLVDGLDKINEQFEATGIVNLELIQENDALYKEISSEHSINVFQKHLKEVIEFNNPKCSAEFRFCRNKAYTKYYETYCSSISVFCAIQKMNKLQRDLDICERRFCSGNPKDDNDGDGEVDGPVPF